MPPAPAAPAAPRASAEPHEVAPAAGPAAPRASAEPLEVAPATVPDARSVGRAPESKLALSAHPLSLEGLDDLRSSDLLVLVRQDERPLEGLAGLVDWRLCGALTRLIKRSLFAGKGGESLLTIAGGRLPVQRIFLYGVGERAAGASLSQALHVVGKAGGKDVAVAPFSPGDEDLGPVAEMVAQAGIDAGLSRLTFLADRLQLATKALVVVEAKHPWAMLENVI